MIDREEGFVLPLALGALVMLALLAAAIATTSARVVEQASRDRQALDARIAISDTTQTLLALLSTNTQTIGGIATDRDIDLRRIDDDERWRLDLPTGGEIPLDGRPQAGLSGAAFALQDIRGLLSLNFGPDQLVGEWLARKGIDRASRERLLATLRDYQDPDDLVRPSGAEREDYLRAGRPPPTNRPLASPSGLRDIIGWDVALRGVEDAHLLATTSTARSLSINLNTAPPEVLELIPGVRRGQALRYATIRRTKPFLHPREALRALDALAVSEEEISAFSTLGGDSGILKVWIPGRPEAHFLRFTLTPSDFGGRPWRIDFELVFNSNALDAEPQGGIHPALRPDD